MEMQGKRELAITQQQAWDALNDPAVLKVCIPGCDKIETTGEHQYAIGVSVKVGPVAAKFAGKIALSEIKAPDSYELNFEGQGGAAGFGKGKASVSLLPLAQGCELSYAVNAQVGGKIAQVGQRLIDGVAKSMAEDFFKRFEAEMQRQYPAPAAPEGSADMVSDSVMDSVRPGMSKAAVAGWALVGLAVLGLLVYLF